MSFVWFADKPLRTREQIAREVHAVSLQRGLDELATVMALMCISVEVGAADSKGQPQWWCPWNSADPESKQYPYDSQSDDGRSVGYFQQQKGPGGELWWGSSRDEMTLSIAANNFLDRLSDKYVNANNNAISAGEFVANVQQCAPQYRYRYATKWDEAWSVLRRALGTPSPAPAPVTKKEFLLPYDRSIVSQETGWWCGPASTQIVLNGLGMLVAESTLANEIEQLENPDRGDDRDGTDYIGLIEKVLDRRAGKLQYTSVYTPNDPMTTAQKELFWQHLKQSIIGNKAGVVANIVAPPSNPPRATKGSKPPPYPRGTTTRHYVSIMGLDDNPSARAVWIADSAAFGGITGFWCPFDGPGSICSLIPPKGYCYSAAPIVNVPAPPPTPKPEPTTQPENEKEDDWMAHVDADRLNKAVDKILQQYGSRSMFRDSNSNVDDAVGMLLNADATVFDVLVLLRAFLAGEPESIARIRRLANGKGPAGSEPRNVAIARALWEGIPESDREAAKFTKAPGE